MRLALDTNAYTAFGRGNQQLGSLVSAALQIGLPRIVVGEIWFGICNGGRSQANQQLLERFLANSRVEILEVTDVTAKLYGEIAAELRRAGRPIQQNDIWIAALCKQYDYALATDDKGFAAISGLELISFESK